MAGVKSLGWREFKNLPDLEFKSYQSCERRLKMTTQVRNPDMSSALHTPPLPPAILLNLRAGQSDKFHQRDESHPKCMRQSHPKCMRVSFLHECKGLSSLN